MINKIISTPKNNNPLADRRFQNEYLLLVGYLTKNLAKLLLKERSAIISLVKEKDFINFTKRYANLRNEHDKKNSLTQIFKDNYEKLYKDITALVKKYYSDDFSEKTLEAWTNKYLVILIKKFAPLSTGANEEKVNKVAIARKGSKIDAKKITVDEKYLINGEAAQKHFLELITTTY